MGIEALIEAVESNQSKEEKIEKKEFKGIKDKLKAVELVTATLNKEFNTKTSIVRLGDKVGIKLPSIPTGSISLDEYVLQCGGIPRGRVIELFGPESSGKTTLALHLIAQEQALGGLCAFVDAEHSLDPNWALKLKVDVNNLLVSQPDSGEQALETVEALVKSQAVSLIVVDSVAALVPQAELDGDFGDSHMGLQARLLSQAMRKLTGICAKCNVTVIFINQIREKIGVMFGSPETTTGGRALKFYASIRIDIRRISQLKDGDDIVGHILKIKAVKNKCGAPFREAQIDLYYTGELDIMGDLLQYAVDRKVVEKSGAWYSYKIDRIGQGKKNASNFLKENPTFVDGIRKDLQEIENKEKKDLTTV